MGWKVRGLHPRGNDIFGTCPDWLRGPPNPLYYTEWTSHHTPTHYAPKINLPLHSTAVAVSNQHSPLKSTKKPSHGLVCSGQQCEITWRKAWKWGRIARLLWLNCRMPTWIGAISHRMPLEGSFGWWICHLSQCARQKFGVLAKGQSPFRAGAGT
jgi:hypothetical protein